LRSRCRSQASRWHTPAFVAAYQSALAVNDLVTAVLIFLQFKLAQSRAILAVASAYLFTAILAVLHQLTFPGLFAENGLFGAGPQTTVWLYMLWHGVFPLLLIAYALMKGRPGDHANPRSHACCGAHGGAGFGRRVSRPAAARGRLSRFCAAAPFRHHDPHQIGDVPRAELFHQTCAVIFDRARADAELPRRFFVRRARDQAGQHLTLAARERLAARKVQIGDGLFGAAAAARRCRDRVAHLLHDDAAAERLLDEIKRAMTDRIDRHRNVALRGHDEDRRRVVVGIELLEDIEPGPPGDVNVENDAGRRLPSRRGEQRRAIGKAGDTMTRGREDRGQGLSHRLIIIDDEDLQSVAGFRLSHLALTHSGRTRQRPGFRCENDTDITILIKIRPIRISP
jgi:Membrane-associated sensor, integral membrane domain